MTNLESYGLIRRVLQGKILKKRLSMDTVTLAKKPACVFRKDKNGIVPQCCQQDLDSQGDWRHPERMGITRNRIRKIISQVVKYSCCIKNVCLSFSSNTFNWFYQLVNDIDFSIFYMFLVCKIHFLNRLIYLLSKYLSQYLFNQISFTAYIKQVKLISSVYY